MTTSGEWALLVFASSLSLLLLFSPPNPTGWGMGANKLLYGVLLPAVWAPTMTKVTKTILLPSSKTLRTKLHHLLKRSRVGKINPSGSIVMLWAHPVWTKAPHSCSLTPTSLQWDGEKKVQEPAWGLGQRTGRAHSTIGREQMTDSIWGNKINLIMIWWYVSSDGNCGIL